MARTANSARKQVMSKPSGKAKTSVKKTLPKADVEKIVEKVLEQKQITETKVSPRRAVPEKKPVKTTASKTLSVSTPKISQKSKPKQVSKASKNVIREIKYYQSNIGFLIPRANIVRIIRGTLAESLSKLKTPHQEEYKFTSNSLDIIHEALEAYLVCLIELSYMAAKHAKRITLFASDIRLISRIKSAK